MKKHQKRYIYICMEILYGVLYLHEIFDLRKNFFEAATKNDLLNFPKKNQNMEQNLCR